MNMSMRESNVFYVKSFSQKTVFSEFASFGGLMNFFIRLINTFLAGLNKFAMNNSMVKKLYS